MRDREQRVFLICIRFGLCGVRQRLTRALRALCMSMQDEPNPAL